MIGIGLMLMLLLAADVGLSARQQMTPRGHMGMPGMMMGSQPVPTQAPAALGSSGCMACHDLHQRKTGPAFAWVAWRYRGQAHAEADLAAFITRGGQGHWSGTMPNLHVPPADAEAIAHWILGLPPEAPPQLQGSH
jgi:cytochrome c